MSEIRFSPEEATLLLGIPPDMEALVKVKHKAIEQGLEQKNEFHLTIIGKDTGKEILQTLQKWPEVDKHATLTRILSLAEQFSWHILYRPELYFIQKHYTNEGIESGINFQETRKSIIQVVECDDIIPYYETLSKLLGIKFTLPFLHMTLFTTSNFEKNRLRGIGLYSEAGFHALNPQRVEL